MSRVFSLPEPETFWAKVDQAGDCWIWQGSRLPAGYGRMSSRSVNGRRQHLYAHRVAWELVNGSIPSGMFICHHCDNPPCVRPDHLFIGTAAENMRDRDNKGRGGHLTHPEAYTGAKSHENTPRGAKHYKAKLSESQVREILADVSSALINQACVARRYGVHPNTIWSIVRGKTWRHLREVAS